MIKLAVIGNPIAHSRSPILHQYFAQQAGIEIEYQKILTTTDQFLATVTSFFAHGGTGLNITVPFKQLAFACAQHIRPLAQQGHSINTLWYHQQEIYADSTDGIGLVHDLQRLGIDLSGRRVLLIGAGGASSGVIPALLEAHVSHIQIVNRTVEKARHLAQQFECCSAGQLTQAEPADIVINATSSSLQQQTLPIATEILEQAVLAYDMVYSADGQTSFTRQCPCPTSDGLGMLIYQGLASFNWWTGLSLSFTDTLDFATLSQRLRRG